MTRFLLALFVSVVPWLLIWLVHESLAYLFNPGYWFNAFLWWISGPIGIGIFAIMIIIIVNNFDPPE